MASGCKKAGRNKNRPSSKAYLNVKRWLVNKDKNIKRHTRKMAKHKLKLELKKPESQRDWDQVQELRKIISQNHTG
jgi:hypothetical protein